MIVETDDPITMGLKPVCAPRVNLWLVRMLRAIDFNDQ